MVVSIFSKCSPLLGEMIQFDYYFSDGLKPPPSFNHCSFVSILFLGGRMDVINDLPMGTPEANTAILSCAEWLNRLVPRQEMFFQ